MRPSDYIEVLEQEKDEGILVDVWTVLDVKSHAPWMGNTQAEEVLMYMDVNHDPNVGHNWETMDIAIDEVRAKMGKMGKTDFTPEFDKGENQFTHIKSIYCEHPDVEVIELMDGTHIGIDDETICYYPAGLFVDADETFSVERKSQKEFVLIYDGQTVIHEISAFNAYTKEEYAIIDDLEVAQSHERTGNQVCIVRLK